MRNERRTAMGNGPIDMQSYLRATLNILDDFDEERALLHKTHLAVLNILADANDEKARFDDVQEAMLNILDDAMLEKSNLEAAQKATINILEDFEAEKSKVERVNRKLAEEIAERKRAEEGLENANKELDAFCYSVSHDLRAPLRGIDGWSLALQEDYNDRLDDQAREYIARVRGEAQRMSELINDLLKLSRVTRTEMEAETVDLSSIAETVAARLREVTPEHNAKIVIQPAMTAYGDGKLLDVVLSNLLGNAFKFTGKREGARIEFGRTQARGRAVYYVRDNGAGFDMAHAGKLFNAFQRLHKISEFPGTGIGLVTVQRIVRRHGGEVWAEGAVNEGATFYFTLEERP